MDCRPYAHLPTAYELNEMKLQVNYPTDLRGCASHTISKTVSFYGACDPSEKNAVIMHLFKCLIAERTHVLEVTAILSGAGVGGVVGFFVAFIPGAAAGAITGGLIAAGGTIGANLAQLCLNLDVFECKMMVSPLYKEWVIEARRKDIYPVYERVIKDDKQMQEMTCPISHEFIVYPVIAPDKRVYEYDQILKVIQKCNKDIAEAKRLGESVEKIKEIRQRSNPFRSGPLQIQDLKFHPAYYREIDLLAQQKIKKIQDIEIKRMFHEAVVYLRAAQKDQIEKILKGRLKAIRKEVTENNLHPKVYDILSKKLHLEKIDILNEYQFGH